MLNKLMRILLSIAVILLSAGCAAKKVNVQDISFRTDHGTTLPNNLRMTLTQQPGMKVTYTDALIGELPQWTIVTTDAYYNAFPEVFSRIAAVSDNTTFAPHLIAHVKKAECNTTFGMTCTVTMDLYWGTGKFIRTFEGEGERPFNLDPMAKDNFYNTFINSAKAIVNQMLNDPTLAPYFAHGFDESLASATPDIPQVPYLQAQIKQQVEEAKYKEHYEVNRLASEAVLVKARTRGYALEEELESVLAHGPIPPVLEKFILGSLLPFQNEMDQAIEEGNRSGIRSVSQKWRNFLERSEGHVSQKAKDILADQLSHLDKLDDRLANLALDEQLAGVVNSGQTTSAPFILGETGTKQKLAVMELESFGGVSDLVVEVLTNTLKDELHATGMFSIISREEIEALANRLALQQKSGACSNSDCLADMGKSLGTKLMVYGSISKIGSIYSLSLRLLDTDTKEAIRRVNKRCKCSDEDLFDTIQKAADELVGKPHQ